jgi:hypothetical protein
MGREQDDEIREVIAEEQDRGRKRPHAVRSRQLQSKFRNQARVMLQLDWKRFLEALSAAGVRPGTKEYADAVNAWNEQQRARAQQRD